MKRRLLSAFLAVMMVLTMAPVAFAADEDAENTAVSSTSGSNDSAVAKIGDTGYATLQAAVDAANNGDTVTLVKDTDQGFAVPAGLSITFDVNGKTLERTGQDIQNNGTLIIRDNTKQGKIIANGGGVGIAIGVGNDSVTTIEYANVEAVEGAVITGKATGATITIEDGVFSTSDNAVIAGNGTKREGNANVITINGGTFTGNIKSTGYIACGIYAPWKDIITVNGGNFTVNNGIGIVARAGQVTVNGGTFTCTGSAKGGVGDKKFDMDAAQCVYFDASNPAYPAYNSETDYIKLQGGTFSSDVSAYCEKNYYTEQNADNTYTVKSMKDVAVAKIDDTYYKTLADAVAAAKADEATTITLLKDVELPSYIYIKDKKNITLDLNGKNITRTGNGVFYVGNAKLRVTGTGTIFENQRDGFAPIIAKGSPDDVADYTTITIDENVTLKGDYAGIFVDTDTAGKNSYHNYGLVINMKGSIDLTAIDGGVSAYGVYVQGLNKITSGNVMQINLDGVTINTGDEAIYAAGYAKWNVKNCTFNAENAAIEVRAGDMTIDGGVYTAMASEFKCEANGNGSTTQGAALAIMQHTTKLPISVYVKNGVFHSAAAVAEKNIQKNDPKPNVDLQIADGQFNGVVVADDVLNFISGGDFSTDPSGYLAVSAETGKKYVAGAINESPYFFRVALVEDNQIPVVPAVGETAAPSAKELEKTGMTKEAAEAVAAAAKKVAAGDTEIKEAVAPIATGITDEKAAKYQQAAANDVDDVEKIEVRAYLEVKPTAYNGSAYTLDITPKYDVVVVGTKNGATAKKVVETNTLNVTKATEVSVQLPEGFVTNTDNLYVQHKGHEYDAAVTANNGVYTANFTNPHGFSPFTISKTSQTVATIGTDKYTSFADAVSAVPANALSRLPAVLLRTPARQTRRLLLKTAHLLILL